MFFFSLQERARLTSNSKGNQPVSSWHHLTKIGHRFLLSRLPVLRNPLSPIPFLHSIDSWPSTARPSLFTAFCSSSSPILFPCSCSRTKPTCRTSLGFNRARSVLPSPLRSQFNDVAVNGGLASSFVFYIVRCQQHVVILQVFAKIH